MEQTIRRRRRWGDNDRHFGPLTFAYRETWRPFTVMLDSGNPDRDADGCHLRLQAFGCTAICELPSVIKPWRQWVDLRGKDWAQSSGYWDEHPREYGFCLSGNHLSVHLGRQTNDSSTTQDWGCFLPWAEWRQVSHRLYHADGSLAGEVASSFDKLREAQDALTRARFAIVDYDDARIEVETYVEEREWRLGAGWFRWLGFIAPKKRSRSLDIRFKSELGPEKGSWKGGTLGHGIEMLPGETQEQAMRRYCEQDYRSKYRTFRITFAGAL